jgi:alpha-L-fucosidase
MKKINILLLLLICLFSYAQQKEFISNKVVPSQSIVDYQAMELVGFVHFNMNTFTDKEWGYGDEMETTFNPTKLDVEQWVKSAKAGGFKELILTAKHHDGFCLWPTKYGEHSVKNSPYKNGKGDIVKEFTDACRKYGIKPGLYLSPWDRNHAKYGSPEYITYYKNQLIELLSNYGEISEIWFDGANGGDGYYGGAREKRTIDSKTYYPWAEIKSIVRKLQPNAKIFSDAGPDVHWIGNENGIAGETFWSTINIDQVIVGGSGQEKYLNSGDEKGKYWVVGQCDVSIRPGWFFHATENDAVKTPEQLVDLYYKSVGRNAIFLLNIPPNRDGLFESNDVASLKEFKSILDETFAKNLATNATVKVSNVRSKAAAFSAKNIIDNNNQSFWAVDDGDTGASFEVILPAEQTFDRLLLQEPIQYGQRISKFEVQAWVNQQWKIISTGTTIGYKRLLRFDAVKSNKIKVLITAFNNTPAISNFGLYKSSPREQIRKQVNTKIPGDMDKNSWKVSTNTINEKTDMIIDGDFHKIWRENISTPFQMHIDLGAKKEVKGFYYLPRADKDLGTIEKYSLYVSDDGINWGLPVAKGEFANIVNNPVLQIIKLDKMATAKFIKLIADKIVQDRKTVSIVEFGLF